MRFIVNRCSRLGSDTAVCEDLRELRDDADGVRLWLKRSRASFRLEVSSWDSEPESWDCWEVTGERAQSVPVLQTQHHQKV